MFENAAALLDLFESADTAILLILVYEMRIQNREIARAVPQIETRDDLLRRLRAQRGD
jgi:hypothetical protein